MLAVCSSLLKRMLSVGLMEFLHHQPGESLNNACHSVHKRRAQCNSLWEQQSKAPVSRSVVSVMRSDSGQFAGHCCRLVVWVVNVSEVNSLPISLSLSDWMCLHSWVVPGKEPVKISHLPSLVPSPAGALHSVFLHYLRNTIMSTLLPSAWISCWGMSTTLQHVGLWRCTL